MVVALEVYCLLAACGGIALLVAHALGFRRSPGGT
jgi:hypothetical protein